LLKITDYIEYYKKTPMANYVYIATSLDGFIATLDGGVEWLDDVPNPDGSDFGFAAFIARVDAILMGSGTYEKVLSFGQWPYENKVFVLSQRIKSVPEELTGKVEIVKGPLADVIADLKGQGFEHLYVDGGKVIQRLLREDLIDELIITKIPKLLGKGIPLFGDLDEIMAFTHIETEVLNDCLVKSRYARNRD
jgi:dihydrofolate reductase